MSGREAEDATDCGVDEGDVDAAESVESDVEEDERFESDRPS